MPLINGVWVTTGSYLSTPSGWDANWVAAKQGGNPKALLLGASDASGYLSSDCTTKSFAEIIRAQLAQTFGIWGDFYHSRLNVVDSPSFTGTPPFVNNGAGPTQQFQGYSSLDTWAGTGSTLLTFTSPYACNQIDIIYLDAAGASPPQYAVDGGSLVAFPALGSTGKQLRLSITGLSNAVHTVTIRQQSANSLRMMGCVCYPTTSSAPRGLGFARMNFPGSAGLFYLRQDSYPSLFPNGYDQVSYLADATSAPGTTPITTGFGFPTGGLNLVLLVLDLVGNDCNQALVAANPTSPHSSHQAMRRVLSALRRGNKNISIACIIPSLPDGLYSDLLTANTVSYAWAWQDYKAKAWDLAAEFNAMMYDQDVDFGGTGVADGYQTQVVGGFHLTDAGHARAASILGGVL